jgi:hypothetical protein
LKEVMLSSKSHFREISGFHECISLLRIEILWSVEKNRIDSLDECTSFPVIIIRAGSPIKSDEGLRDVNPFLVSEESQLRFPMKFDERRSVA